MSLCLPSNPSTNQPPNPNLLLAPPANFVFLDPSSSSIGRFFSQSQRCDAAHAAAESSSAHKRSGYMSSVSESLACQLTSPWTSTDKWRPCGGRIMPVLDKVPKPTRFSLIGLINLRGARPPLCTADHLLRRRLCHYCLLRPRLSRPGTHQSQSVAHTHLSRD